MKKIKQITATVIAKNKEELILLFVYFLGVSIFIFLEL